MTHQVFNPDDWNAATAEKVPQALSPSVAASSNLSSILAVVDAVEASGIDITPTYDDWLSIAFALVSELGEDGRNIFHRLSRFNPHYEYEETDRQYSHCLKDGSREITLGTLFHIAQVYGVRWECPPLRGGAEGGGIKGVRSPKKSSSQPQFEDGEDLRMSKALK
ncbi:MAG: PriCT-2 domain-containing protein, partial [Bacteroidales bacterium]|nr:PriCT-2 domain-containing protein [Bacteroidales bacterium]